MQTGEPTPLLTSETGLTDCRKRASTGLTREDFRLPALSLLVMTIALLVCGVRRSMNPDEAAFLLRIPDRAAVQIDDASFRVRIQVVWASVAGSMERPARFLSLLCTMIGLGLMGIGMTRCLGGKGAAVGMLAVGALPQFWSSGVGIGSDATLFCAISTLTLFIVGRRSGVAVAVIGLLMLFWSWDTWPSVIMAASPAIGWSIAWGRSKLTIRTQSVAVAGLTVAMIVHVVGTAGEVNQPHAERLDWIRTNVDSRATLLIHGPNRHITRYLQTAHHRTGHSTILLETNEDLNALARRLYLDRHPLVVVIGCDERLNASLNHHFRGEDVHDGVRIFRIGK